MGQPYNQGDAGGGGGGGYNLKFIVVLCESEGIKREWNCKIDNHFQTDNNPEGMNHIKN